MDKFTLIVSIASGIMVIFSFFSFIIKPIREKILGINKISDGQKCILRSEMLQIYYKNYETKKIRQYEYENFLYLHSAYKALNGNSFIDKIKTEVDEWTVIY